MFNRIRGQLIAAVAPPAIVLSAIVLSVTLRGGDVAIAADDDPKNLTVFPKDISKRELVDTMKQWTQALGVRCDFCHEQKVPGDFQSIDFASDKVGHKDVARRMYTMMRDLNGGPLPKAAGEDDAAVNCFTCHRGLPSPTTLERVVLRAIREKGAEGGVQKYRELRERYYGSGSFDFSSGSLQSVTETLAAEPATLDAALTMARLNLEMNPKFADGHVVVAQILDLKQDKAGALTAVEEALKLDPNHRHAQRLKQKLTK
ncbi:MAG: c-type cytochrome [bacterium]|nr:c-type cytochrome [bacterium]